MNTPHISSINKFKEKYLLLFIYSSVYVSQNKKYTQYMHYIECSKTIATKEKR